MLAGSDGSVSICWLAALLDDDDDDDVDDVKRAQRTAEFMTKASKGSWMAGLLDQSFRQKYQSKAAKNHILGTT